jgi:ATP-dependent DNA ligase
MLAKPADGFPAGDGWLFDPKWDGFRSIVFRDGDEIVLGSRNEKPLTRYFPELVDALRDALPRRCVLDGEIVVVGPDGTLDFEALQQRIHPAASRVDLLAGRTPASFVAFDLLALGDDDLRSRPLAERRALLTDTLTPGPSVRVTPATTSVDEARDWFVRFEGAGCDGMIAKRLDGPYVEDKRVMLKIKHARTADCVVAGFRWHKDSTPSRPLVGSLLLGLWGPDGRLHQAGITASFTMARRAALVDELAPWRDVALTDHPWGGWKAWALEAEASGQRLPGATSRWNAGKDLSFEMLRPTRVVEVAYDHLQGDRFRHATTFRRWRDDRDADSCTSAQLEEARPATFAEVMAAGAPPAPGATPAPPPPAESTPDRP